MQKTPILTAGHPQRAGLFVQGVQLQIHGTGERQGDSDAVEHITVGEDADVHVRHYDVVEVAFFLVREE